MRVSEINLSVRELRDAANILEAEGESSVVDKDSILNALRTTMFAVQRMSHGCGLACESVGEDAWSITKA